MSEAEQRIRLRGGFCTSTGQVRENNEDNLHLWMRDGFVLAIVADGMGGAAAGEEASRLAVEWVEKSLDTLDTTQIDSFTDDDVSEHLQDTIRGANETIVERAAAVPEFRGMGTTATLAFVRGSHVLIAHVGDSRAYHVDGRTRGIAQVTTDHSFVEALVAAGHLTHEQAEEHPMQHVLYRALGQTDEIDIDIYETRVHAGDRLVLCSDGLTRHVKPSEIAQITLSNDDPEVAANLLIDRANALGGADNISAVVLVVESTMDDESTLELRQVSKLMSDPDLMRETEVDTRPAIPVARPEDTQEIDSEGRDHRTPEE